MANNTHNELAQTSTIDALLGRVSSLLARVDQLEREREIAMGQRDSAEKRASAMVADHVVDLAELRAELAEARAENQELRRAFDTSETVALAESTERAERAFASARRATKLAERANAARLAESEARRVAESERDSARRLVDSEREARRLADVALANARADSAGRRDELWALATVALARLGEVGVFADSHKLAELRSLVFAPLAPKKG